MPIYEFKCDECGAEHEILMSRGAKPPACGECDSCLLRLKAFADAGIPDPIPYREKA